MCPGPGLAAWAKQEAAIGLGGAYCLAMSALPVTDQERVDAAEEAGLRYVPDSEPGWSRERVSGSNDDRKFRYRDAHRHLLKDEKKIERAKSLVIPPAWEDVWICPSARGHLQATGRDEKGRKQYRYHDEYRKRRDHHKYERMEAFGGSLPKIRERVDADLKGRCLSREKVLATVVRLLQDSQIRVGNQTYARDNDHFGLTTLRRKHVELDGKRIRFEFTGKSGKEHKVEVEDPRLMRAMMKCVDLPGYELFKYVDDDGDKHKVDSGDVNEYLREITGEGFTAKDFRTWAGTVIAAVLLHAAEPWTDEKERDQQLVDAIKATSAELGNTPATCRKYYIHPVIIEAHEDGSLHPAMEQFMAVIDHPERLWMSPEEAAVLAMVGS